MTYQREQAANSLLLFQDCFKGDPRCNVAASSPQQQQQQLEGDGSTEPSAFTEPVAEPEEEALPALL